MKKQFLEVGKITGTHGVRGELRVEPWTDSPEYLRRFEYLYFSADGSGKTRVLSCRAHGGTVLLALEGINTVEDAASNRGRVLFMDRNDAGQDDGGWFIQDLIGCEVYDADDTRRMYGTLTDVSFTGANDVWHITGAHGGETLVPAIKEVIAAVDTDAGRILIRPMRGLFNDD